MDKLKTKGTPTDMDVHVGRRLRVRRAHLGISQDKLAEAVGLTFQQIQKYERGSNRISSGRLYDFSKVLGVPISYFFEQFEGFGDAVAFSLSDGPQEAFQHDLESVIHQDETLDLIHAYYSISDPVRRRAALEMILTLSRNSA